MPPTLVWLAASPFWLQGDPRGLSWHRQGWLGTVCTFVGLLPELLLKGAWLPMVQGMRFLFCWPGRWRT